MSIFAPGFCWNKGRNELGKDLERAYVKAPSQNAKWEGETENAHNNIFGIDDTSSRTHHRVKRATTTPFVLTQEQKDLMVKLHNDARAMVTPPASDMKELVG